MCRVNGILRIFKPNSPQSVDHLWYIYSGQFNGEVNIVLEDILDVYYTL